MKMFMKKEYSSFLFIIMMLGLFAPTNLQAYYRGLRGRAAKYALLNNKKQQKELEDLKAERDDLAVRALQGNPAGYLALQKKMNKQLALAGAAAALTAATIYALQKKIANLKQQGHEYSSKNKEILDRIAALKLKNKDLEKEINDLKEKQIQETQELRDENAQEKEGNEKLKHLVNNLVAQHTQLINEKLQVYENNDAALAQLTEQLNANGQGMEQIVKATETIQQQLAREQEQLNAN